MEKNKLKILKCRDCEYEFFTMEKDVLISLSIPCRYCGGKIIDAQEFYIKNEI